MEKDLSRELYDKYFRLTNRHIQVTLSNGRTIQGIIIGFFRGNEHGHDSYISRWHVVIDTEEMSMGQGIFGGLTGEIINQEDIMEVLFEEDKSVLRR
jgi:hypothetical protein